MSAANADRPSARESGGDGVRGRSHRAGRSDAIVDTGPTTALSTSKRDGAAQRLGPPLALLAIILGIWFAISYGVMNPNRRRVALPPPQTVLDKGFLTWKGTGKQGLKPILTALLVTGRVALLGLLITTILGILIAIVMNRGKWAERALMPYIVIIYTTPILALTPLLKIWLGAGINARIMTCVLIAIFPVIINTLFGLQSTERAHHELFTLHQASKSTRLFKLELPGALPSIFTGLRIAAGGCVIGAVVGDYFFTQGAIGIGRLINNYQKDNRIPEMFAATLVSSIFGILIFLAFGALSNRVLRTWHESARAEI